MSHSTQPVQLWQCPIPRPLGSLKPLYIELSCIQVSTLTALFGCLAETSNIIIIIIIIIITSRYIIHLR